MPKVIQNILEFIPLVIFFIIYKSSGIIPATYAIIITTTITLAIYFAIFKKVPWLSAISALILAIFGGLTIFSGSSIFIKIKPTIFYLLFAAMLLIGFYTGKSPLKHVLGNLLELNTRQWATLTYHWILFFIICALLNEAVWRNCEENTWVNFKVFGMLPIIMAFNTFQIMRLRKFIKK